MLNKIELHLRRYPVTVRDLRSGEIFQDFAVIDKRTTTAAGMVGESDRDLIFRDFNKRGYWVLEVGKPEKKTVELDLVALWKDSAMAE